MFKRKRYLKMLMSLLLVALVAPPVHAEELTVADGDYTQVLGPIYANSTNRSGFSYGTGYVEILYPKSLLTKAENDMTGCNITGITYYSNQFTFTGGTIEVQICETSNANLNSEISETPTTIATFSDVQNYYNSSTGMWTLDFGSNSFTYSGDENLLVRINVTAKGSRDGDSRFYYKSTYEELGSSTTVIKTTYTIKSSGHGSTYNLPKTTFTYEPATVAEYDAKVSPSSLSFGSVQVDATSELSVALKNKGTNALTYTVSGLEAPFSTTVTSGTLAAGADDLSIPVTFAPTAAGAFEDDLVITFGSETGLDPITVHVTGTGSDAICDGGATNQYLPVYGFYYDYYPEVNQMVYPASKLEKFIGKKITGMTFYPATYTSYSTTYSGINFSGGSVTFKLANLPSGTTPFASSNATRIVPEDITTVKTFSPEADASATEWVIKEFTNDVDFVYDGGDLLIEVVTEKGDDGYTYFYGETTEDNRSFYSYGSTGNGQSFLPKISFSAEDALPEVKVAPAELNFGGDDFVIGGEESKAFKVSNTTADAVSLTLNDENGFFSINPTTAVVEAGTNATIEVTYAPTSAGTHNATVIVGDKTVTLTGTAIAPVISGTVTPAELTFEAYVKDNATKTITIANTGNTAFTPVFSALEAPFSIEAASKIDVGESKNFTVTYAPTAVGTKNGTLTVDINGTETNVTLNGTATLGVTVAEDGMASTASQVPIPVEGSWFDNEGTLGQTIYSKNDIILLAGNKITKVKYYSGTEFDASKIGGAVLEVYLMETDENEMPTGGLTFTGDALAEYEIQGGEKDVEFNLLNPYSYSGAKNLAIQVRVKTASSSWQSIKWIGKNNGNVSYYKYGSYSGGNQYLPKTTFAYEEAPATKIATLEALCGSAEGKYTIQEELLGVYMQDQSVWFKDANGSAIDFQTPGAEKVYWINDVSTKDFDQSNWIEVDFTNVEIPEAVKGEEPNVKIQNLTGIFTNENGNPKLVLTETPAEVTALTTNDKPYEPNVYIPAHFEGTHQGYFFSYPKAQEYAKFIKAQWDGSNMVMTSNTEYNPEGLTGSFTIKPVDGFDETHVGKFYEFHGIIRKAGRTTSAPRIKAEGDSYEVEATDLDPKSGTTTAISTISINGGVKSVKYVSVAGLVSDRPFEGVNIVVTEYTDGSRTTTKMVK